MQLNCSERKNPPTNRTPSMTKRGVSDVNIAHTNRAPAAIKALPIITRRKPNARTIGVVAGLVPRAPTALMKVMSPAENGDSPKPICN